jgi:hypothetical protein
MTDLNLAELDRLERAAAEQDFSWNSRAYSKLVATAIPQVRPLLDLVAQMGKALDELKRESFDAYAGFGPHMGNRLPMGTAIEKANSALAAWEQAKGGSDG